MEYIPHPISTESIRLNDEIEKLVELLARNAHDRWALQRFKDGWSHGDTRDDTGKTHPCLIPYEELPEIEKEYDRIMARETLKAICALGFIILPPKEDDAL